MARAVDSLAGEASTQKIVRPVILAELDFASGPVRVSSAPFPLSHQGQVFAGVGALGAASAVAEGAELQGYAIQLTLSAIPVELVSVALADQYQGRQGRLWLAFLDEAHQMQGEPLFIFAGRMDTCDLEIGETATITLTIQNRLADWERPRLRRYTDEDQQSVYDGDLGLQFVAQMAEKTIYWGR
jgi:hypothetical protein